MNHASLFEICCVGGSVFLASNLWFFVRVLRPIQKLSSQAAQLSQGELDSLDRQGGGIPEIRTLRRAMSGMVGHVRRAQQQSQAYAEQLADGQENERKRIARELHDDAVQSTIAITQGIDMAKNWVKTDPDRAVQMLQLIRIQAVAMVASLRTLIGDLRPPALEELGLIAALEMQLAMIQPAEVKLTTAGEPRRLAEAQELTLFRVAQEALRNIKRHSQARHIHIDVDYQPLGVALRIQDDGCGFRLTPHPGDLAFQQHYGLLGIQERVTGLEGRFEIDSQPGKGTRLNVYLPTTAQKQPDDRVRDPVCSALIEPHQAYGSVLYQSENHYFCCPVCQGAFQKDPDLYLNKAQPKTLIAP
ncbi:MAG: YHS domain-containing protein [Anaerolineae bacterium]|nr:YHS domain-containing protein [Anaerolineae bacterium]